MDEKNSISLETANGTNVETIGVTGKEEIIISALADEQRSDNISEANNFLTTNATIDIEAEKIFREMIKLKIVDVEMMNLRFPKAVTIEDSPKIPEATRDQPASDDLQNMKTELANLHEEYKSKFGKAFRISYTEAGDMLLLKYFKSMEYFRETPNSLDVFYEEDSSLNILGETKTIFGKDDIVYALIESFTGSLLVTILLTM